jgi:hypothetical protein
MANAGVAGYISGGSTTVDKFAFPGDTRTTLASGLSATRTVEAANANSEVAGYFGGGIVSANYVTTVDKFAFPSDTRSTLGTGLSLMRAYLASFNNEGVF